MRKYKNLCSAFIALCLGLYCGSAFAGSSEDYLKICERSKIVCVAFAEGVEQSLLMARYLQEDIANEEGKSARLNVHNLMWDYVEETMRLNEKCTKDVTYGQRAEIWIKFLKDNPNVWNKSSIVTFIMSQKEAFPCGDN